MSYVEKNNGMIILAGDVVDGFTFCGPYADFDTALDVAMKEFDGHIEWSITELVGDSDSVKVIDCDTAWCKHCNVVEKEK